jgi:hypothetical protein
LTTDVDPRGAPGLRRLVDWKLWVFALLVVVGSVKAVSVIRDFRDRAGHANRIEAIVESEAWILKLTPELRKLSTAAINLKLPDEQSVGLFEDPLVQLTDIAQPSGGAPVTDEPIRAAVWSAAPATDSVPRSQLVIWEPLLEKVDHFKHATFYFIRGEQTRSQEGESKRFDTDLGFRGLARTKAGSWRAVHSRQRVVWSRAASAAQPGWRIAVWEHLEMSVADAPRRMFRTVLREALPHQEQRFRAERSLHEEKLFDVFNTGAAKLPDPKYLPYFKQDAMGKHPAISVVDIDRDGFDDLYVMARWGRNQLFRNLGDGTFNEIAGQVGLDIDGLCTGAIFGDFDNDGDADVFIGRWLEPSLYFVNMGGRFVDRSTSLVKPNLPALVTSLSAADYDGDGLLDIYFSTYAPPFRDLPHSRAAALFLPATDVDELIRRLAGQDESAIYLNSVGPPNVLLKNLGQGKFGPSPHQETVALWANTFQSTWADYDEDGDPDLYVANDFAPDFLLQNDGADGFTDVTRQLGGKSMMGFGMGASFGDYDQDGRQDLYVSNMYSKAGMRIVSQIPGLDGRFRRAAEGNRLFRFDGNKYRLVSGATPPALAVTKADWSWGGQFVDVDNDGFLDIYAASGYYSAPRAIACDVDL